MRRAAERGAGAAVVVVALACSFDARTRPGPWTGETEGLEGSSSSSDDGDSSGDATCDEPCDAAPSDCFEPLGECERGRCVYAPRPAFTECADGCDDGGHCDANGTCICDEIDCGATCVAGPNATATCTEAGECVIECTAPWQDCDGDPANGCEIPVGVPHTCSLQGIDPEAGCWAAYCGSSGHPRAIDFGTFYCVDCSTCREPEQGRCQWCDHDDGTFYPVDFCACDSEHFELACAI